MARLAAVWRSSCVQQAAIGTIIDGQQDALEHARATVQIRTWTAEQVRGARSDPDAAAAQLGVEAGKVRMLLAGALDTAVAGCVDFEHSPMSDGGACTASFLLCLACPNAVATPAHLPRLVCLHHALTELASAMSPTVCMADYGAHFARLDQLLTSRSTPEERATAAASITSADRALVDSLLRRGMDA